MKRKPAGRKKFAGVREPVAAPVAEPIAAGDFKARCLALMDEVSSRGTSYVITKRGKPVARLVPVDDPSGGARRRGFGALKGSFKILGDIVGPAEPPDVWENEDDLFT